MNKMKPRFLQLNCPISFRSGSKSLRKVLLGLPLLLFPCGFHLKAWWVSVRVDNNIDDWEEEDEEREAEMHD